MSEIFLNPNSIYRHSQANFLLNKDQLFAFATAVSGLNNSIYGIQPSPGMMVSGFTLSDIFAINPLSTNSSLCANVYLLDNNMDALKFFASRAFVVCNGGVKERDRIARNPLAIYLTPVNLDTTQIENSNPEEANENNISDYNDFYEWLFVLPENISSWEDVSQIYISAETNPDFRLSSIDGGKWELIGTTSWTDEKLSNILDDVNDNIQSVRNALENFVPLSGNAEVSGVLSIENRIVISDNSIGNACTIIDKALGIQTNIDSNVASAYFETGYSPDYINLFKEDHVSETSSALILEYPYDEAQILGESSNTALNKTLATREWTDKKFVALSGEENLSGNLYKHYLVPNPNYGIYTFTLSGESNIQTVSLLGVPTEVTLLESMLSGNLSIHTKIGEFWDSIVTAQPYGFYDQNGDGINDYGFAVWQFKAPDPITWGITLIFEVTNVPPELGADLTSLVNLLNLCKYPDGSFGDFVQLGIANPDGTYESINGWNEVSEYLEEHRDSQMHLHEISRFALMTDIEPISSDLQNTSALAQNAYNIANSEPKFTNWKNSYGPISAWTTGKDSYGAFGRGVFGLSNSITILTGENANRVRYQVIGSDNAVSVNNPSGGFYNGNSTIVIGSSNSANTGAIVIGDNCRASLNEDIVIGSETKTPRGSFIVGMPSRAPNIAIGYRAGPLPYDNLSAVGTIAIGSMIYEPKSIPINKAVLPSADFAIQLGAGTNTEVSSFQVYDWKLLNHEGKIPAERIEGYIPLSGGKIETRNTNTAKWWPLYYRLSSESNDYSRASYIFNAMCPTRSVSSDEEADSVERDSSIFIGNGSQKSYNARSWPKGAVAIGGGAVVSAQNANNAIQLGAGMNALSGTFQVRDWQLLDQNGNIPSDRFKANTIPATCIKDNSITTQQIKDNGVNGSVLIANSVTGATNAQSTAVPSGKIGYNTIGTPNLRDNAVTPAKLDRAYVALSDYEILSSDFVSKSDLSSALSDLSNVVDFNYDSIENENSILSLAHNVGVLQTVLSNIAQLF